MWSSLDDKYPHTISFCTTGNSVRTGCAPPIPYITETTVQRTANTANGHCQQHVYVKRSADYNFRRTAKDVFSLALNCWIQPVTVRSKCNQLTACCTEKYSCVLLVLRQRQTDRQTQDTWLSTACIKTAVRTSSTKARLGLLLNGAPRRASTGFVRLKTLSVTYIKLLKITLKTGTNCLQNRYGLFPVKLQFLDTDLGEQL